MKNERTILVTGGAGFIGANFVLQAVAAGDAVANVDLLTYAGNAESLAGLKEQSAAPFCAGRYLRWGSDGGGDSASTVRRR